MAANWTLVPPQHICKITSEDRNRNIPSNGKMTFNIQVDGCRTAPEMGKHVKYLEHVQARITLSATRRGELEIFLISPIGTRSCLLARRPRDLSRDGFVDWPFMSTHTWGESSYGVWKLEIRNWGTSSELKGWSLTLYGTENEPYSLHFQPPTSNSAASSSVPAMSPSGLGLPARGLVNQAITAIVATSDLLAKWTFSEKETFHPVMFENSEHRTSLTSDHHCEDYTEVSNVSIGNRIVKNRPRNKTKTLDGFSPPIFESVGEHHHIPDVPLLYRGSIRLLRFLQCFFKNFSSFVFLLFVIHPFLTQVMGG